MSTDLKIILAIFIVAGIFILIKGFQSSLGILDIFTIYTTFTGFVIGFTLLTSSIIKVISWLSTALFKKYKKKIKNIK